MKLKGSREFLFSIEFSVIGEVHVYSYRLKDIKGLVDIISQDDEIAEREIVDIFIANTACKSELKDDECPEERFIEKSEVQLVPEEEIEQFSKQYIETYFTKNNEVKTGDPPKGILDRAPQEEGESYTSYIARLIKDNIETIRKAANPFGQMLSSTAGYHKSLLDKAQKTYDLSKSVERAIEKTRPPKATDRFWIDVGKVGRDLESPDLIYPHIDIPDPPGVETNRKLNDLLKSISYLNQYTYSAQNTMYELSTNFDARSDEFKRQAERTFRLNKWMVGIAVFSLLVTSVFSFLNYQTTLRNAERNKEFKQNTMEMINDIEDSQNQLNKILRNIQQKQNGREE